MLACIVSLQMVFEDSDSQRAKCFRNTWGTYQQKLQHDCSLPYEHGETDSADTPALNLCDVCGMSGASRPMLLCSTCPGSTVACLDCIDLQECKWLLAAKEHHWTCGTCRCARSVRCACTSSVHACTCCASTDPHIHPVHMQTHVYMLCLSRPTRKCCAHADKYICMSADQAGACHHVAPGLDQGSMSFHHRSVCCHSFALHDIVIHELQPCHMPLCKLHACGH